MKLFATWGVTFQQHAYFVENIIMFIPLGILLPLAIKGIDRWYKLLSIALLCSIVLEIVQLFTQRGFCQLDDVVTNVTGALVGYFILYIGTLLHAKRRSLK